MSFELRDLKRGADKRPLSYREKPTSKIDFSALSKTRSMYGGDGERKKVIKRRNDSFNPLEELVQCEICFGRLTNPKMLTCQHTFCKSCLEELILTKNTKSDVNRPTKQNFLILECVVCCKEMEIENGIDGLDKLPTNVYIESLLKVVNATPPSSPTILTNAPARCVKCQSVHEKDHRICAHCRLNFCMVCWSVHAQELGEKLLDFQKQLVESKTRLKNKYEDLEMDCMQLKDTIRVGTEENIRRIKEMEIGIMQEVQKIFDDGTKGKHRMDVKIDELIHDINTASVVDNTEKIAHYIESHKKVSDLLKEISQFGEINKIFDIDNYKLEQASCSVDHIDGMHGQNVSSIRALESNANMLHYYKTKNFTSKLIWSKCPKLAGIGIAPWAPNSIYVAATDSKAVLILNKSNFKLIGRLSHPDMLCPYSLTFCEKRKEMFVTDKWNHCVHVFNNEGDYTKTLCTRGRGSAQVISPLGITLTPQGDLLICDSGNDRVLIIDPNNGQQKGTIGVRTEFNLPTDITVFNDRIFIADTGNNRVKVFNANGIKLKEFGILGKDKGQFRCAEAITVDPLGNIIVGDSGNIRLQVFDSDGNHIRSISCANPKSDLKWISGVYITNELDVIITDHKNRCMQIF